MESVLDDLQRIVITAAGSAVTALCLYAFNWLRTYLGIKESDSNEAEIRRAALTEAGKLVVQGKLDDPQRILESAGKIIADLHPAVKAEGYDAGDIKDMIIGAAATVFPPAGLLKLLK
jgi:hypothetical protein